MESHTESLRFAIFSLTIIGGTGTIMERQNKQPDYLIYLATRTFDPGGEPLIPPSDKPEYYIVQFNRPLTGQEREKIRLKYRLSLEHYIPDFAFLELLNFQTWAALSKDTLYRAISLYQWSDKISPEIDDSKSHSAERRNLEGQLIRVILFPSVTEEEIAKVVKAIESARAPHLTEKRADTSDTPDLEFDPTEIRRLDDRKLGGQIQLVFVLSSIEMLPPIAKLDEVQWIEEVAEAIADGAAVINCPGINTVAGTIQSGDPTRTPVWDRGINGRNQKVGIIDHALVDVWHCMFKDDPQVPIGPAHRKVLRFEPVRDTGENIHGTAVASIAVGDEFRNTGRNNNRGIAWAALLSYDDRKGINNQRRTLLDVLTDQAGEEVTIHSNSWHDDITSYNLTSQGVDTFVRGNEQHFVCGSTANSSASELLGPPGTAKNALCVSASKGAPDHLEHGDGLSGPTPRPDDRRKPEICAPGCGIMAAEFNTGCGCIRLSDCSTSWATPVIAGAAALVRQYYMEGWHRAGVQDIPNGHTPSAALIKATLLNSTVPMVDVNQYPNNRTGWGLVKLDNTLYFSGGPRKLFFEDLLNVNGLVTAQSRSHSVTVQSAAETLKITLVWSDPPASIGTGKALVNDLNLIVTAPNGGIFRGNINFSGGFSLPEPQPLADDCNNVEMVVIKDPAPGAWTITVNCFAANTEKQGYALVATGSLA